MSCPRTGGISAFGYRVGKYYEVSQRFLDAGFTGQIRPPRDATMAFVRSPRQYLGGAVAEG